MPSTPVWPTLGPSGRFFLGQRFAEGDLSWGSGCSLPAQDRVQGHVTCFLPPPKALTQDGPALSPLPAGAPDFLLGRRDRSSVGVGWEGRDWPELSCWHVCGPPLSCGGDLNVTSDYNCSSLSCALFF